MTSEFPSGSDISSFICLFLLLQFKMGNPALENREEKGRPLISHVICKAKVSLWSVNSKWFNSWRICQTTMNKYGSSRLPGWIFLAWTHTLRFFFFLNLLKADLSSFSVRPSMEPHRFAALRKGFDDVYWPDVWRRQQETKLRRLEHHRLRRKQVKIVK